MNNQSEETLRKRYWQVFLVLIALLLFLFSYTIQFELTSSDIGRHLINGKIFFNEHLIPNTNLYSYTNPDFPFINHHWLFGVLFYPVFKIGGLIGVSLFFILINFATALILLIILFKKNGFLIGLTLFFVGLPLMTARTEIRPEAFTYLFSVIYYYVLSSNRAKNGYLWLLVLLQILWVNIHVYFPFGIFLIFVFTLHEYLTNFPKIVVTKRAITLSLLLAATTLSTLINPFFWQGALYPLQIFHDYAFTLVENLSPVQVEKIIKFVPLLYFKFLLIIFLSSWIFYLLKGNKKIGLVFSRGILSLAILYLAFSAIRNFSLFAIFGTIIIGENLSFLAKQSFITRINRLKNYPFIFIFYLSLVIFLISINSYYWQEKIFFFGLGEVKNNQASINFFQANHLSGPIFNNYDIGSFLIYGLYPAEKVFVDNRPEAYPGAFFRKIYTPMLAKETIWKKIDDQYNFNAIFFFRLDQSDYGQRFIFKRIQDSKWSPVFVDRTTIILLKRNEKNQEVIKKYEIPREMFRVRTK